MPRHHLVIPDTQVKPGVPISHLYWLAHYALDKGPEVVCWMGDHWDMPSLSLYDRPGSRTSEGKRVHLDIAAGHLGMRIVQNIWTKAGYQPEQHWFKGNHEWRWDRALEAEPSRLEGMFPKDDPFNVKQYGIKGHRFLDPVSIDGVRYAHFFPHGARGNVSQTKRGAPSALAQVQRQMSSATAGHQQGLDIAVVSTPEGMRRGLIAGSFYLHDESYLGPLNQYWRGLLLKHSVHRGNYNLCEVDMGWLQNKYQRLEPHNGKKVA
jgi:hypothetical protein